TSTMIQFNLRSLGGTRESAYRVHLWQGSRIAEEKSINETSTAFLNLLPDHEYQISVDVLTCSKNVSTSLTVRTAANVFSGTTRIINEDFIPEYQNKSSTAFKEFENKFIKEIEEHLPKETLKLIKEGKMHIVINSLRNGSVIVDFNIVLDIGKNITKKEISDAFMEAFNRSTVLKVDLKKTFIEARNSCQPGLNDCSKHAICTVEGGSYSCQCKEGFTDRSMQVPGRVCQQKQNLPSEHMTTVPAESAIVRFTGSTANSTLTTIFGSGSCMPVSIEIQNVTGKAIQFRWILEGGSRGSFYIASLMDGYQEINKTTTNETNTTFDHLLPGHVYTVSVASLSCAEKSRTSATVRTDPSSCFSGTDFCSPQNHGCSDLKYIVCSNYQAFACSALLKTQTFNHTLYNSESEDYKTKSESIKTAVARQMQMKLQGDRFDIVMLGFRPGSVVAYFVFLLQKQELLDVNVLQAYLSDILKSKFGNQTEVTVQCK
ncbi:UROL1 protein, partial [Eudromia elegans]|nr:UROL1 protein [Eudromia elegans]